MNQSDESNNHTTNTTKKSGTLKAREISNAFNSVEQNYGQINFKSEIMNHNKKFSKEEFSVIENKIDEYLKMNKYIN